MVSSTLLEIWAENPIRNIQADGREEEGIRSGHRTGRESSGPCLVEGEVGFSELLDNWELLAFRDVSIPAGTPCLAYHGYTKTLPANSRTHPDFCFNGHFVNFSKEHR